MKFIIAGGSGYLGTVLTQQLQRSGHNVITISRTGKAPTGAVGVRWSEDLVPVLDGASAIVNLAGANVGARRWSPGYQRELVSSRVDTTRALVEALTRCTHPPALVNMSGTGFYGNSMTPMSEAMGAGQTFLAQCCAEWEAEAVRAESVTRVVRLRMAPVLDPADGMLAKLLLPMRLFIGGTLGTGLQWVPWIHRDDAVTAILWAATTPTAYGPYNVAGPEPVTMRTFVKTLGHVVHRPTIMKVPSVVLRLVLGHMADTVLHGQRIAPYRLEAEGCHLTHRTLKGALTDLLRK